MADQERISNYDKFKMDALARFLTYDQEKLIQRLNLQADEEYIYVPFCGRDYRIGRQSPSMEYVSSFPGKCCLWKEANSNAVLTICDLLCHTADPIFLSGTVTTLEGLNRVKGGSTTILGDGFYGNVEKFFDGKTSELAKVCEMLEGVPMGKGDVAYKIPLFENISLQISFYESDDEFPAKLTFFLDQDICKYLFYETLWYMIILVMEVLMELMEDA